MKTFTDTKSRAWNVEVNVAVIKRLRTALNFDLAVSDPLVPIRKLAEDVVLQCDVVYQVCKPQADQKNVSEDDFFSGMAGDPIEQALRVFLDELADFTPNSRTRERLRLLIGTMRKMADLKSDQADLLMKDVMEKGLAWAASKETPTPSGVKSGDSPAPLV